MLCLTGWPKSMTTSPPCQMHTPKTCLKQMSQSTPLCSSPIVQFIELVPQKKHPNLKTAKKKKIPNVLFFLIEVLILQNIEYIL